MFLIALGLPLFTLTWQSFFRNLSQPFMGSPAPATLENYRFILSYPVFLNAVRTSVVVSAMAGATNQLVQWCTAAAPLHDAGPRRA